MIASGPSRTLPLQPRLDNPRTQENRAALAVERVPPQVLENKHGWCKLLGAVCVALVVAASAHPQAAPASKQISYLESNPAGLSGSKELWTIDAATGARKVLVNAATLSKVMQPEKA